MVHREVVIIGAGQCGLAAGRLLQKRNVDFLIIEKNKQIGDNWRNRYDSLRLFTPAALNALPDLPMALTAQSRPNKNQMADYFNRYVDHFDLPVSVNEEVREISKEGEIFTIKTILGEYTAEKIIIAAGFCRQPSLPDWSKHLTIPYLHSSAYKSPISVKGKKVLVVGSGNSAAQIGAELTKYFKVDWSTTGKSRFSSLHFMGKNIMWMAYKLGILDKPASEKLIRKGEAIYLYDDLKKLLKKIKKKKKVISADGDRITFEGGETETYDFVLFATGFQPGFDFIQLKEFEYDLSIIRDQHGISRVSNLFFVGIPYQRSRSSHLIYGSQRDATFIVDHLSQKSAQ